MKEDVRYLFFILFFREEIIVELGGEDLIDIGSERGICYI